MKKIRFASFCVLLAFSIVFPLLFSDPVVTTIAIFTLIIMAASTGWNLFSGYTRYLSLGHATFYGLGAYILAIVCQIWHVPGGAIPLFLLPVIGLITAVFALPLGWIALQTRRSTFMVITIAIFALASVLPRLLGTLLSQFSNIYLPIPMWDQSIFNLPFYYAALLLLFCALGTSWWMRSSKFGLTLLAIGDDEDRALGLGNRTSLYKLVAWTISAMFVGMAGSLNAYYIGLLDPASAFERGINVALPVTAFLGGIGTLAGPLIGALFTVPIQQYLTLQFGSVGLDLIMYGALLLVVILFLPQGLAPALQKQIPIVVATFLKRNIAVPALDASHFPVTPAIAFNTGFSYDGEPETPSQILDAMGGGSIRRSNSVPLSMPRGYSAMKAPRLVPLSEERNTDSSRFPAINEHG